MENKIARFICKRLLLDNIIPRELEEVYVYGLEIVLSFITSIMCILLVGFIMNQLIVSITFILIFVFLRRFTGGFHATTHFRCKCCTIFTFLIVVLLSMYCAANLLSYCFLLIVGETVIIKRCPIENENKPLSNAQKQRNKSFSIILFALLTIIGALTSFANENLCNGFFYSLISVIALVLISKNKGEKENEKS